MELRSRQEPENAMHSRIERQATLLQAEALRAQQQVEEEPVELIAPGSEAGVAGGGGARG